MKDKTKTKPNRLTVRITDDDRDMVEELKEEHGYSISSIVRKAIRDKYNSLIEPKKENK